MASHDRRGAEVTLSELIVVANALYKPSALMGDAPVLVLRDEIAWEIAGSLAFATPPLTPVPQKEVFNNMLFGVVMLCGCQIKTVIP
jgi:hypothetical protein